MTIANKPCAVGSNELPTDENCSLKIEWLDSKSAAKYLCISVGTLRNMTSNGQIPYHKLGRRNRYALGDLHQLLSRVRKGGFYGN